MRLKRFYVVILLLCLGMGISRAQDTTAVQEDSLQVSLLTCSPGTEIYQYYGHTALLVRDFQLDEDFVFNYGLFDFGAPNFMWRFLLGRTDYMCGGCLLEHFLRNYAKRGSGVREDVLNLTAEEKQSLYDALKLNCEPQNATYHYDFFYDNCATRVRDKIEQCVKGTVKYTEPERKLTVRQIVHEFSAPYAWSYFGQDLLLGAKADKPATREDQEFAPTYLEQDIRTALIVDTAGLVRPLVKKSLMLLPDKGINYEEEKAFPISPMACCYILLVITTLISAWDIYKKKPCWIFDLVVMLLQGLAGLLITFMFFFSIHPTVDSNWQVLLFNPLPLVFLYWVIRKERANESSRYHAVARMYFFVFILATKFIPQYISTEVLALALCLLIRSMSNHIIYAYRLRK